MDAQRRSPLVFALIALLGGSAVFATIHAATRESPAAAELSSESLSPTPTGPTPAPSVVASAQVGPPDSGSGASAGPGPLGSPPMWMTQYTNASDGYSLWLLDWMATSARPIMRGSAPQPGVMEFGRAAFDRPEGELTIRVGSPDGTIRPCRAGFCDEIVARTLDDLERAFVTRHPSGPAIGEIVSYDTTLGGEPARAEVLKRGGYVWGPPAYSNIYAFHGGRPVALMFDAWSMPGSGGFESWPYREMLSSFRFLEAPEPPWQTMSFPEAGLEMSVPASWWVREDTDSSVRLGGPGGEIEIRHGTGGIRGLSPPGILHVSPVDSIDDLVGIVRGEYRFRWGMTMQPTMVHAPITLDGVPAIRLTISPPRGMSGPGTSHFVLAYNDGRALLVEWIPDFSSPELFDDIVARIRLTE